MRLRLALSSENPDPPISWTSDPTGRTHTLVDCSGCITVIHQRPIPSNFADARESGGGAERGAAGTGVAVGGGGLPHGRALRLGQGAPPLRGDTPALRRDASTALHHEV